MNPLTREEWINRATAHFVKREVLDEAQAREVATSMRGDLPPDIIDGETPEETVDEELTYWDDDGEVQS